MNLSPISPDKLARCERAGIILIRGKVSTPTLEQVERALGITPPPDPDSQHCSGEPWRPCPDQRAKLAASCESRCHVGHQSAAGGRLQLSRP